MTSRRLEHSIELIRHDDPDRHQDQVLRKGKMDTGDEQAEEQDRSAQTGVKPSVFASAPRPHLPLTHAPA